MDLRGERQIRFARRLLAGKQRMLTAVKMWMVQLAREARGKREAPERKRRRGPAQGPRWGPVGVGEWIVREFVKRNWRLPEAREVDYALHGWLVRAAVVGGNNVGGTFHPELEQAIAELARVTWQRLEEVPGKLHQTMAEWDRQMEAIEQRQEAKARRLDAGRAPGGG